MNEEIFDQLKEIIVDELDIDGSEIKPESVLLSDLDINSLELMNLVMVVEEKYNIFLDEERLRDIKTVGDVVSYVAELKG
ncbi:MAG: acyl carrier protein [Firmicutes bacterium]|uniref:Acyl carrier protein n=1 Tax=Candidatus Colimorpha enterica TaxID=3083063 RepID=R6UMM6_9BACT|nr:acyl carrier protein [Candidatus Colimorpha enterica]MCI5754989.1 acyl carrier protein [Candidatus Colimorpha enterica]MDY2906971.1 acyl carrier protein [Eubacteriales bacterium]CDC72017.1 acyl carrier protein [Candidatus Colimorpha enterica]